MSIRFIPMIKAGSRCGHTYILAIAMMLSACQNMAPLPSTSADAVSGKAGSQGSGHPYLLFNQRVIEGLSSTALDVEDVDALFWHVFSGLPDEVIVYPSENYYYFILKVGGREIWGNIRLPAGQRDQGVLSFGYFERVEFPVGRSRGLSGSKYFKQEDGVEIKARDPFTYVVSYQGKQVVFHLNKLNQELPMTFPLGEDEVFVERTIDESGYRFVLLFNVVRNYFLWVLDEEQGVPDTFVPLGDRMVTGKMSGFAFWVDAAHGGRKVLAGVRMINIKRNDYYDGPFDQLADNYAREARIADYIQRAAHMLHGRIDQYGYYTDKRRPMRVALSNYYTYVAQADLLKFMERAWQAADPYEYISRRGAVRKGPGAKRGTDGSRHSNGRAAADLSVE